MRGDDATKTQRATEENEKILIVLETQTRDKHKTGTRAEHIYLYSVIQCHVNFIIGYAA